MTTESTTPRGRPRSSSVGPAVAVAVTELLTERGYQGISVEQIAARAGVGKATLYRRWGSKAELIFDSMIHGPAPAPPPDMGSLAEDLAELIRRIVELVAAPATRAALPGLLADLHTDPQLSTRFSTTVVAAERGVIATVLERAVQRGEIDAAPPVDDIHALLLGPILVWVLVVDPAGPVDVDDVVARTTRGVIAAVRGVAVVGA